MLSRNEKLLKIISQRDWGYDLYKSRNFKDLNWYHIITMIISKLGKKVFLCQNQEYMHTWWIQNLLEESKRFPNWFIAWFLNWGPLLSVYLENILKLVENLGEVNPLIEEMRFITYL